MTNSFNILFRYITLLLFIAAGFSSCNENPNAFTLKGTLKHLDGNNLVFVRDYPDSVVVDTIVANKDGDFSYKGTTDTLMLGSLYFNNGRSATAVFFNKGEKIKIDGDADFPDLINVKGNEINEALSDFKKSNKESLKARTKLLQTFSKEGTVGSQTAPPKPNPGMISKLSNLNFQLTTSASEYIKKNPEKIASVMLIQSFFKDNESVEAMEKKLQSLKEPASNFFLTDQLQRYVDKIKSSQEGASAPNFVLKDANGKQFRYDQYRRKYLLLSFVSNDCPLCRKNQDELSDIYKKYKDKQVEILSVIVVEDDDHSRKLKNGMKADWPVITLKDGWVSKILSDYNVNELPLSILIYPDGTIAGREESPAMLQPKLPV